MPISYINLFLFSGTLICTYLPICLYALIYCPGGKLGEEVLHGGRGGGRTCFSCKKNKKSLIIRYKRYTCIYIKHSDIYWSIHRITLQLTKKKYIYIKQNLFFKKLTKSLKLVNWTLPESATAGGCSRCSCDTEEFDVRVFIIYIILKK